MKQYNFLNTFFVVLILLLPMIESQAPPAPPAAVPAATDAGAPAGASTTEATPVETIFPNLKTWRDDFAKRLDVLNKTIAVTPVDDEETKKMKLSAQEITKTIGMRMSESKMMLNRNQRIIANQLADLEEKLSSAGRKLFGIKWNSIPCGAGFAQAQCGNFASCP